MPRNSTPTLSRPRDTRAVRTVRASHTLESTTYNLADQHHPHGWSARCSCGASTGNTRYDTRDDATAAHAGHVRRYLPAGTR